MRWFYVLALAVVCFACTELECVDCVDNDGTIFTFCDPAVSALDSLSCGEVYTRKR
jgi:hypothetical protein